jgi:polyhydroxyalkanoate synthesis regulator phasin
MAGYRQIHTQIWKDEWVIELEPEEKLFFIYLFSNDLASISGLYKIPVRVMMNETGIQREQIEKMLNKFQAAGKIFYGDNTLFIKNMMRYHKNASPKTMEKIKKDVGEIPDCEAKRMCIQYLCSMDTVSQSSDTVSILDSESVSLNESKSENVSESESGSCSGSGSDDDNDNDDPEENAKIDNNNPVKELENAFFTATHIKNNNGSTEKAREALQQMAKAGVLPNDIHIAVAEMVGKGYNISGPWSLVTPAINVMGRRASKRKQPAREDDHRRYITGEFGNVGVY